MGGVGYVRGTGSSFALLWGRCTGRCWTTRDCRSLPPCSQPPTDDPQASADRPTEQRTDRPSQPAAAGGLSALFLFIHVVAVAGAAAAGVVPLNLPRLLLLVLVVVGVVGGGDTPLMARSLAANEGQGARVAPAATAAAAAGAAETSANLTFHREGVSEREGQNTSIYNIDMLHARAR